MYNESISGKKQLVAWLNISKNKTIVLKIAYPAIAIIKSTLYETTEVYHNDHITN